MGEEFGLKGMGVLWDQSKRIGAPQAASREVFARPKILVKAQLFWYKE